MIALEGVVKDYRGLRPLRIASLAIAAGERVALSGLDASAAEVLVNLINGAGAPDAGTVTVNGCRTTDIPNADAWLASLEQFGIVTTRAVLLEGSTVAQNLALPFTLAIDELPDDVQSRVDALADEVGVERATLPTVIGDADASVRLRVHLAKSLALAPRILLLEHPTLGLEPAQVPAVAADIVRICEARGLTALILSNDQPFIQAAATRALALQPSTGVLEAPRWWQRWFGW